MQSFKITIDHRDFIVVCLPGRPKALLDRTVAEIYEVETKRVNEAVKNNPEKFPEDFYFELTPEEFKRLCEAENYYLKGEVVENFDHISNSSAINKLKYSPHLPKAFTHLGCNMLATVLKSSVAVQRAIQIIRTFTALESGGYDRRIQELEKGQERIFEKLEGVEKKCDDLRRDLQFLLWEGEMETSPFLQIHKKIRSLEEKLDTVMMDGRFRSFQLQVIYSDVCQFRKDLEKEIEEGKQKGNHSQRRLYFHDEELRCIKSEVERIEKKIETLLLERKERAKKKNLLPVSVDKKPLRISAEEAEQLKDLVHKKARGNRKKIGEIWSNFKKHFHLTRYKHLPANLFYEAIKWLRKNG